MLLTLLPLLVAPAHGGVYRPPYPSPPLDNRQLPPGRGGAGGPGPSTPGTSPGQPGAPGASTPHGALSVEDLSWRHWWELSSDRWIDLKGHVHGWEAGTGTDDFYLGRGTRLAPPGGDLRPGATEIDGRLLPALLAELEVGSVDRVSAALIALGKVGRRGVPPAAWVATFERHLRHSNQEVGETAALALGLSGEPTAESTLLDLALDRSRGRTLVGASEVPPRTRAFAAYGLGLLARAHEDLGLRQRVCEALIGLVEEKSATRDLPVAAVSAFGLVTLGDSPRVPRLDSGRRPGEHMTKALSRRTQLEWLLGLVAPQRPARVGPDPILRAHAATALARLGASASATTRRSLVTALVRTLRLRSEREEVHQSVALALGWLVDADEDREDVEARAALLHALEKGQPQVRRFALIALARIGARAGTGEAPRAGLEECRAALLDTFSRGKSQLRPWAGLALGVLGRGLADDGSSPDPDVSRALRSALTTHAAPESVGAYALALGLRRDVEAVEPLLHKLGRIDDPLAQGDLVLALGLIGQRTVAPALRERIADARYRPTLLHRLAVALALLQDREAVPQLVDLLAGARSTATRAALAAALGAAGDRRAFDPLRALLEDSDATDGARAFAAAGLGGVADRHRLPWSQPYAEDLNYRQATPTQTGGAAGLLDIL